MRAILRFLVWVCLFVVATFCWVVVFEHGCSGFADGCAEEWRKLGDFLASGAPEPDV